MWSSPYTPDAAGVVLAGGRSRRFGRDKAGSVWRGRPMLEHAVRTLGQACAPVLVVSRPEQPLPPLPAHTVSLHDPPHLSGAGPLAALAVALGWLDRRGVGRVFVAATDMPTLSPKTVRIVLAHLGPRVAMAAASDDRGRPQPLCAALRVGPALRATRAALGRGVRAISVTLDALDAVTVPPAALGGGHPGLRGVNTPAELAALADHPDPGAP